MKKVVHLRVYKGKKILKDENGKIDNENQIVSLVTDTVEYSNYLSDLPRNGYCKVEIEKCFKGVDGVYEECDIPNELKEELDKSYLNKQETVLTPEQKEIAELKLQMAELLAKKTEVADPITIKSSDKGDLSDLQLKYKEQEGKEVPPRFKNDEEWIKNKLKK